MKKLGWFLLGALSLLAVQALAVSMVLARAHGWSARQEPLGIERWIARRGWAGALPAAARSRANPAPKTQEVLAEARAHWADHCASCHANDGSGEDLVLAEPKWRVRVLRRSGFSSNIR